MSKLQVKTQTLTSGEEERNKTSEETSSDCIDINDARLRKIRGDFEKKRKV
jgi:hypothetical protein